ncbi:MAG: aminotransferase class I/II-fold pyridoxal phosphate-dependent enzyme [Chloroflexi bacterium]|nr:aminotransferase class I/II-fold pyridoxal phosphate-dependent enzyme [Chloroflexota bacterium]
MIQTYTKAMFKPAERIAHIKPYFFADLGKRIAAMKAKGADVVRMDIGSPDLPPPGFILESLFESASRSDTHGYTLGQTLGFRKAIAAYYQKRFGVELDPKTEAIDLIGSKEGLFVLSQVLLNPGDLALVPDPSYAVYAVGAQIAGGAVHLMPLLAENAFLPDFNAIPSSALEKAKILWLNYPNNPTGAIADLAFFERAVAFAREHGLLLAHDNPYCDVGFDGYRAPSLMQVRGAKEVAIEFNSMSKTYNMAGWRVGMVVGNPQVVKFIETYKSQQDSAIFAPLMAAAEAAMLGDQSWLNERNRVYQERRDAVIDVLHAAGLWVAPPQAALYVWAPVPGREGSMDFCAKMLEETSVSTTPGVVFGRHGEGYFRISLVGDVKRLREGAERISDWMHKRGLI